MKASSVFWLIVALGASLSSNAQTGSNEVSLDGLTIPSSPAATIMGEQPMEITRPKNMSQLESSLLSNFSDGANLILPDGVALEFMPYWLKPRPGYNYDKTKDAKNRCRPWQNFAASIATVNRMQGDTLFRSQVAFGFRTLIFSGKMAQSDMDSLDVLRLGYLKAGNPIILLQGEINTLNAVIPDSLSVIEKKLIQGVTSKGQKQGLSNGSIKLLTDWVSNEIVSLRKANRTIMTEDSVKQKLVARIAAEKDSSKTFFAKAQYDVSQLAKQSQKIRVKRYGWRWEVAGATFLDFPTQSISFSKIPKLGLWSNLGYTLQNGNLQFIFMGRYIHDFQYVRPDSDGRGANSFDLGGSLVWDIGRLSISGEGIYRNTWFQEVKEIEGGWTATRLTTTPDYRVALNVSFRVSKKILLAYSFGKALNTNGASGSPLVNQLSINLGFGDVPIKL